MTLDLLLTQDQGSSIVDGMQYIRLLFSVEGKTLGYLTILSAPAINETSGAVKKILCI
jgi:hypothetical protein